MIGDLQTLGQVELAPKIEWLGQVMDDEAKEIDSHLASVHVVAIHAQDIIDGLRLPLSQPGSARAANIDVASHRQCCPYSRNYPARGIGRPGRRHILECR